MLRLSFGEAQGYPDLHVLDSTDPAQVLATDARIEITGRCLSYRANRARRWSRTYSSNIFTLRTGSDGGRFIAITDPGSHMQKVAEADRFRHICFGSPAIGGRFSALSDFGMIPAAILGIDVETLLARANEMARACTAQKDNRADAGRARWER